MKLTINKIPKGQQKLDFLIEDKTLTRAEIRPTKVFVRDNFGKLIKVAKSGVVEKRIENRIITVIQKRTHSIDIHSIENEAMEIVNAKLKALNIAEIGKEIYSIAIAEECRKLIKLKVSNRFEFTKKGILEIAKTSSNNIYHLTEVLQNLQSKETRKFEELYVSDDFSEIRKRDQTASFLPTLGEDYSLTNKDLNEKIIFTVNEDLLPYMIAPNKKSYGSKGYIVIYNDIIDEFEFTHTLSMYKIIMDIEKIWQNAKFSYKEVQARFGTKYGVKKKKTYNKIYLNSITKISENKFQDKEKDIFTLKEENTKIAFYSKVKFFEILSDEKGEYFIKDKIEKDRFGDPIYEEDEDSNYIYEEDYYSTYRFFKRDVIDKAIAEINKKSPFIIKLIEHRKGGLKATPIEAIQFQVTRKKNNVFNNMMKYRSLGYYAATRINFHKLKNTKTAISNLDEYAKKLDENFDNGEFQKPILEIQTLSDLAEKVEENYEAIVAIKDMLLLNIIELSHLTFSEEYLVIFDTSTPRNQFKMHNRLGDDAIECLEFINKHYMKEIEKDQNKTTATPIFSFLPFEFFSEVKERPITISQKSYGEMKEEIETAIKNGQKSAFKKFKNKDVKNQFYALYFGV